jgi:plasmid stabilization system protein ParE
MKYRVLIQPGAEAEVAEAFGYIHARSPANAARWLRGLYAAIGTLETMPKRCGLARENDAFREEIRQFLYGKRQHKYRILFTVRADEVQVLHVRHAARQSLNPDEPGEESS